MKTLFTKRVACFAAAIAAGLLFSVAGAATSAQALTCTVSPDKVPVGITYHGAKITVSGESQAGDELIVKISTEPKESHLRYIGKAANLVWMKQGDMTFKNVPAVYQLYSTREIDRLLDKQAQTADQIGFAAIEEAAEIETTAPDADRAKWLEQFIKFKTSEKVYKIEEGTITRQHGASGDQYRLEAGWPYQASPGDYKVEVLAVRDGSVVDRASTTLNVAQVGAVEQLSDLAFNRAAIYGVLSIVVALVAGFGVGALFKKGGGAH